MCPTPCPHLAATFMLPLCMYAPPLGHTPCTHRHPPLAHLPPPPTKFPRALSGPTRYRGDGLPSSHSGAPHTRSPAVPPAPGASMGRAGPGRAGARAGVGVGVGAGAGRGGVGPVPARSPHAPARRGGGGAGGGPGAEAGAGGAQGGLGGAGGTGGAERAAAWAEPGVRMGAGRPGDGGLGVQRSLWGRIRAAGRRGAPRC